MLMLLLVIMMIKHIGDDVFVGLKKDVRIDANEAADVPEFCFGFFNFPR